MDRLLLATTALLLLSAGCTTYNSPVTQPTEHAPSTASFESTGTPCSGELQVSFWGLNEESFWASDVVRVTYTIPANESVLLVTYVDGNVSGVDTPGSAGVHADGATLELDAAYSGAHQLQVVAYDDVNENDRLDVGTDRPCLDEGEIVQAGPTEIDYSRFE